MRAKTTSFSSSVPAAAASSSSLSCFSARSRSPLRFFSRVCSETWVLLGVIAAWPPLGDPGKAEHRHSARDDDRGRAQEQESPTPDRRAGVEGVQQLLHRRKTLLRRLAEPTRNHVF